MPIILEEKQLEKLSRRKRQKRFKQPKTPKTERVLRRSMERLWQQVLLPASDRIKVMVKEGAPLDQISAFVQQALDKAQYDYGLMTDDVVSSWGLSMDKDTRGEFRKSLMGSLGVDITAVLDTPEISDAISIGLWQTTNLIKTIPDDYFGSIAQAVADNFYGKPLPEGRSLLQQVQFLGGVSKKRAGVIARDQTQKMRGNLDQVRQRAIGSEEYIWRNSKDNRVVGKPGGLYPPKPGLDRSKVHGNHWEREGKTFRWNDPPPDGHPGQGIQCRCWSEPVIDFKRLMEQVNLA